MLSHADQQRIKKAIKAATKSRHHKIRVGAVVAVAGRLSSSPNIPRNDARICWQHASVHAEEAALAGAYRDGIGGVVYVARIGQSGRVLPSFPCKRCVPALRNAGIRKVVWFDGQIWMASRL